MAKPPMKEVKVGRDAKSGHFIPVEEARRRKSTAVVETIKRPAPKQAPPPKSPPKSPPKKK